MECSKCQCDIPNDSKFCKECGSPLTNHTPQTNVLQTIECERKHVTVLFADLSGYTAMTERLDPEDVKAIMSRIFAKITHIITKYDGHIERFIGDAVMAVFGMPVAHELDPVRAIRATIEIHELVDTISPKYEATIGCPISMHSGLNTGLVVTGEVDLKKGTHGITGDSVNTAARIQNMAGAGEILIGQETFRYVEGYFKFESRPPCVVKGKSAPLYTYKVLSRKQIPDRLHRVSGRRAKLIGRETEMGILAKATARLETSQGSVISICGKAGTGKSRLVNEFKATLNRETIQWHEGHTYGFTRNIPYYPLINLLTNTFKICEGEPPEIVKAKVKSGTISLLGKGNDADTYIGSLFGLDYPQIAGLSPEYWKEKLVESLENILSGFIKKGATIVCFEDLHWADTSFIEILMVP